MTDRDDLQAFPPDVRAALRRLVDTDQAETRRKRDRETMWRWVANGMKGRLVRINGGPVQVVPCHPDDDGEMLVRDLRFR